MEAFGECGLNPEFYACRERSREEILPPEELHPALVFRPGDLGFPLESGKGLGYEPGGRGVLPWVS